MILQLFKKWILWNEWSRSGVSPSPRDILLKRPTIRDKSTFLPFSVQAGQVGGDSTARNLFCIGRHDCCWTVHFCQCVVILETGWSISALSECLWFIKLVKVKCCSPVRIITVLPISNLTTTLLCSPKEYFGGKEEPINKCSLLPISIRVYVFSPTLQTSIYVYYKLLTTTSLTN